MELSKKDCQLLKEENLCRQQELKQVKPGFQSYKGICHGCVILDIYHLMSI